MWTRGVGADVFALAQGPRLSSKRPRTTPVSEADPARLTLRCREKQAVVGVDSNICNGHADQSASMLELGRRMNSRAPLDGLPQSHRISDIRNSRIANITLNGAETHQTCCAAESGRAPAAALDLCRGGRGSCRSGPVQGALTEKASNLCRLLTHTKPCGAALTCRACAAGTCFAMYPK